MTTTVYFLGITFCVKVLPDLVKFMDSVHNKIMQAHAMSGKLELESGGEKSTKAAVDEPWPQLLCSEGSQVNHNPSWLNSNTLESKHGVYSGW